jgi:preprotein translocase subunit SecG
MILGIELLPIEFFPFLFLFNSVLLLFLILNQNESGKELLTQNSSSFSNPLEKMTWFCFFFYFFFLLVKTKLTDI